jgi:hypothetical protein
MAACRNLRISGVTVLTGLALSGCAGPKAQAGATPDDADAADAADGEATGITDAGGDVDTGPAIAKVPKIHRAVASACTQPRAASTGADCPPGAGCSAGSQEGGCQNDQACTAGMSGRCSCAFVSFACPNYDSICSYDACQSDSDCGDSGVCECRGSPLGDIGSSAATVCRTSNCRTDSECGTGGYCSPSPYPGCGSTWWYGYFCHTPQDECTDDSDCSLGGGGLDAQGNAYCAFSGKRWICSTGICSDG